MVPNVYRATGLAFLLFGAWIGNVGADATNKVDEKRAVATRVIADNSALPTSNLAQVTSGVSHADNIIQSVFGVALTSTTQSGTPPATTNHAATLDLSTSFQNKTFLPLEVDGHQVPISCLNCSTTGTLDVTGTGLSLKENPLSGNDTQPFNGGIFTALLPHGLKGRIELGVNAPSTLSHTFNLSQVPITGFAIPGVADAGVTVDIGVQFSLQLSKPSEVSFGFEFEIPEDSSIHIDVANEEKSKVHGFGNDKEPKFNILPVNVSGPGLDTKLSVALILDLAIGADLLDSDLLAEIGARLAIPVMVEERQLSHVDSKCNPLSHATPTHSTTQAKQPTKAKPTLVPRKDSQSLLGNYTNIIPVFGMEMNVFVAAGLQGSFVAHDVALNTGVLVFKTASMLPTTCISNHKSTSALLKTTTTTTRPNTGGATTTHGQTGPSSANATSAAAGRSSTRESGESFLLMSSSAGLALAIAVGWLVVNF